MEKKIKFMFWIIVYLLVFSQSAHAVLTSVGPSDPNTGFPIWYRDSTGRALQLCTEQPVVLPGPIVVDPCLLDGVVPTPGQPIVVPTNSPDEMFWWMAGAITPIIGGAGSADLVLALEAAFGGGAAAAGDQVSFGRVRIRVDTPVAGNYRITHPYGVRIYENVGVGIREINFTEDIGITPGDFRGALSSRIGPFLRWDTDYPVTFLEFPGMQFVGDPAIDHTVTGSPFGTNFFRVEADTDLNGSYETLVAETNLFSVMGKIFGGALPIPITDFDLDGKTDIAIYDPVTGIWWIVPSTGAPAYGVGWGGPAFTIVPGEYDADGKTDIAIYDSTAGAWWIVPSSGAPAYGVGWGGPGFTPVPGDYDGDGKTDIAIYDATTGGWWIIPSTGAPAYGVGWGGPSFTPVPADYDGDGKTDAAIYDASTGSWFIVPSSGASAYGVVWGGDPSDIPVPADYDGDGKTDVAFYRSDPAAVSLVNWVVIPSSTGIPYGVFFGGDLTDRPVPGDYDRDGKADIAIYRKGTGSWFIVPSSGGGVTAVGWGGPAFLPVTSNLLSIF